MHLSLDHQCSVVLLSTAVLRVTNCRLMSSKCTYALVWSSICISHAPCAFPPSTPTSRVKMDLAEEWVSGIRQSVVTLRCRGGAAAVIWSGLIWACRNVSHWPMALIWSSWIWVCSVHLTASLSLWVPPFFFLYISVFSPSHFYVSTYVFSKAEETGKNSIEWMFFSYVKYCFFIQERTPMNF